MTSSNKTGQWNCGKCDKSTPLNNLTKYSAKLVISYGELRGDRKEITDASVQNPRGLCQVCLRKVAVEDKYYQDEVENMDVLLVPSERFGVFHSKYGDWCNKYCIELDTVTGYFICTQVGYGSQMTYQSVKELIVDVNFFKNDDYYKSGADGYKGVKNIGYSSKTHRHNPTSSNNNNKNKNKNISNEDMPEPSASPPPPAKPEEKTESLALPQLKETQTDEYSELLKEFGTDVAGSFDTDKRLKKKKKPRQHHGSYTYPEVNCILDGMARRAAVGSVRDVKVFIFESDDFEQHMIKQYGNRGSGGWHSCWINLRDKKHTLLKKKEDKLRIDPITKEKKFVKVPTLDALKLWKHVLEIKKVIDDSKNKKWLFGNSGESVLDNAEKTRHCGGIISSQFNFDIGNSNNSNMKNPIFNAHTKHQTQNDVKNKKKDRWFTHSEDKFFWSQQNAVQVNKNAKEFTMALNQIGQTDKDKQTLTDIGKWLIKLPDTVKFVNKYTGFAMMDIVKQNSSKYLWLWNIAAELDCKTQKALDEKRIELFEKELKNKK